MTKEKVQWGVLGASGIARRRFVPGLKECNYGEVRAVASRDEAKARKMAEELNIPVVYGSYEALLEDPEIDAVYIPLPNHLHFEWTMKCLDAGKHVLCEKPFVTRAEEVKALISKRDETGLKVGEAFMVRSHPRWHKVRQLINEGAIGKLRLIEGHFTYNNTDPKNIRNAFLDGGGGMWDIGCYPIQISRYLFGEEPEKVAAFMEREPDWGVDILGSAIMKFPSGQCSFSIGTQVFRAQSIRIYGTEKSMTIEMPFNPSPDKHPVIKVHNEEDPDVGVDIIEIPSKDQFTYQGDDFSRAILEDTEVPVSLEDTMGNTRIIQAMFRSAESGLTEAP